MRTWDLVIAGCLSGERDDAGIAALAGELAAAVGAGTVVRARTGGRPMGASVPEVLAGLCARGARRVLVATTHVADGRLQRTCAADVAVAGSGFEELRLAAPLLADERDLRAVAAALDEALPARAGRIVALAGHRGADCEATLARLEAALRDRGRPDVLVGAPELLAARLDGRPERAALLAPMLMALGHHARRDVLVDLRARLERADRAVTPWPHALAELPAVRDLVVAHARAALE
ncbi:sirohydrochlorin cobaltochelatase [Thermophilibacter sp.]